MNKRTNLPVIFFKCSHVPVTSTKMRVLILLIKQFVIYSKRVYYIKNIQVKHFTKAITGDHMTQLDEGTLTGRLLIYLNHNKNTFKLESVIENETTEMFNILKRKELNKLRKCNIEQVVSALTLLLNRDRFNDGYEILKLLNVLDNEFCRRLPELETKDKFKILQIYMNIIPNRIIQYKYYDNALKELFSKSEALSKDDLIKLMFYIGLQKKTAKSQYMLRKCIKLFNNTFINNLTTEEMCIICNSTFKTSTKINNQAFLIKVTNCLINNLYLLKDPAFFITFLKTIRHNRYQNEDFLATLSCAIFFNKTLKYYSFSALCHILALYSDYLYYDSNLIKTFTTRCIEQLKRSNYTSKHTYLEEQPRVKDMKRFLWCLSNSNYNNLEANDIKNVIIPNIMKRLEAGELKNDFTILIDFVLYLWMLNYRAYELIPYALTQENIQFLKVSYPKSPVQYRLNLLLSCIYCEDRKVYKKIGIHPQGCTEYETKFQLARRPVLQKILDNLKSVANQYKINKYDLNCPVPYLNIIGITGYRKQIYKAVYIEVLDDYTSMKNTNGKPSGLMQLKLRILKSYKEGLIVIRADDVNLMSDEELHHYLLDELNLVC